ncbi:MAG: hypothetical protein V4621_05015 [Pseudomonadota bacterium]
MKLKSFILTLVCLAAAGSPSRVFAADTHTTQALQTRQVEDCRCVICSDSQQTLKNATPSFCGTATDASAFVAKYDADKAKNEARCNVVSGPADSCPMVSADVPYLGSTCQMSVDGSSTVIETSDANGISCRHETCSGNGCVAPGWQQVIAYKTYNQIPVTQVPLDQRDRYYAFMTEMRAALTKSPRDVPYVGPQDFCMKYPGLNQLNSTTCIGPGGRLDITYGTSAVTLLYRNGVTLPVSTDLAYKDMNAGLIRAIPYQHRTHFNGGRP